MLVHIIEHTAKDTVMMIPFLLVMYLVLGVIDKHHDSKILEKANHSHGFGPIIGAIIGILPQCGISILATGLYVNRGISLGTLIAVYISTSDEAVPILFAHPECYKELVTLIGMKIGVAIIVGCLVDFLIEKGALKKYTGLPSKSEMNMVHSCHEHHRGVLLTAIFRTAKIFVFIFVCSFVLSLLIHTAGEKTLGKILAGGTFLQPILAAIVGFIPNCATSVIMTQLYLDNLLSYGALIAGLITNAGLGLLALLKMYDNKKDVARIAFILFIAGSVAGIVLQIVL